MLALLGSTKCTAVLVFAPFAIHFGAHLNSFRMVFCWFLYVYCLKLSSREDFDSPDVGIM